MFDCMERTAHVIAAIRVLNDLLPDNDDYPELWERAVQA